jgi:hypothetical protein
MPPTKESIRTLYESAGSPGAFVREMYHYLGLANPNGRRYTTPAGNPYLRNPLNSTGRDEQRRHPSSFSLRALAEGILGDNWAHKLNPGNVQQAMLIEQQQPLLEAGTGAIGATDFLDINAFTAVVTGLFEVTMLEGFNRLEFIGDQICPDEPTKVFGGKKVIGVGGLGDKAEIRKPGMPTKRANETERWINTPETQERALACEVTQEAVYLDNTGAVLSEANDIGYWLRYRKELRIFDVFIGVSGATQYNYKGTTYNTYISGGYYDNDVASNKLTHWTNVQSALIKFRDMRDPETNTRVTLFPNICLVNLERLQYANMLFGPLGAGMQVRDSPDPAGVALQQLQNLAESPYRGKFTVLTSPLLTERITAADGLNLSLSTGSDYWWLLDTSGDGAFRYAQNWPLRTQTASPTQMDMIDRGIILFIKCDERGEPYVRQPRKVVRNKP